MFIKKRMDLPFFVFSSFFRLFFLVRTGSNPNQSSAWLARRGVAVLGKAPQIVALREYLKVTLPASGSAGAANK